MTETKNDTTKTEGDPVSVQSVAELYEVVAFLKNTGKAGMALAEEAKELAERERRISARAKALQSKADHLAERETVLHRKENDLAEAEAKSSNREIFLDQREFALKAEFDRLVALKKNTEQREKEIAKLQTLTASPLRSASDEQVEVAVMAQKIREGAGEGS